MPINVDIDKEDKERAASLVGRIVNGLLLAVVVFLITPGRIGDGIRALWNLYLQALGLVATGLGLSLQWLLHWYQTHRRRVIFFGVILPFASWILGAWIGGTWGRIFIASGSLGAIALANLLYLATLLLARGGQLLVEMVQVPAGAGIKGLLGILRSVSPESFQEEDGQIRFIDTERLVRATSATQIVPLAVGALSFWLVLFPSFTTLFGCVLVLFGGPALIHMGGLWEFETRWGQRAVFRLTKTFLALAIAGLFYGAVFPKSAEWVWVGSGQVDQVMVDCVSDAGECAARPFRGRSVSPVVARQAPRALGNADVACRWRMAQLQTLFDQGGVKFADYRARLEQITRSCEGDRRAVSAAVKEDWSVSDRAVAFLPILGWLAFVGAAVFFIKGAAKVRRRRRARREEAGSESLGARPAEAARPSRRWFRQVILPMILVVLLVGGAAFAIRYREDISEWLRLEAEAKPVSRAGQTAPQTTMPSPSTPSLSNRTALRGAHDPIGLRELDRLDRRDQERRERYPWLGPGASQ